MRAKAIQKKKLIKWQGYIWVDEPYGNEDPYVFSPQWIYSYCHATQLRRKPRADAAYVKQDSCLFFCSGDAANNGMIQPDTVFVIEHVALWPNDHEGLPPEFREHFRNNRSELWRRHFRFPFLGYHKGKYTYVGRQWAKGVRDYSFIPVSHHGERIAIDMGEMNPELRQHVWQRVNGKYPVPLDKQSKRELLELILAQTDVQVVTEISRDDAGGGITSGCK